MATAGTMLGHASRMIEHSSEHHNPHIHTVRSRRVRTSADERAAALFDEGEYEYDAGEYPAAREIFEELVSRFPDTKVALKAQRYLARLYASPESRPERRRVAPPEIAKTADDSPEPDGRKRALMASPREPAPEPRAQTLVPDRRLQMRLLRQAGDRVFFAPGSAELGAKARIALRRQAAWLRQNRPEAIRIAGHADEPGGTQTNIRLSRARALAVRQRLIEEGVDEARLRVVAHGRSEPVAVCQSAECAVQNRRAVTVVLVEKAQGLIGPRPSNRSAWSTNRR